MELGRSWLVGLLGLRLRPCKLSFIGLDRFNQCLFWGRATGDPKDFRGLRLVAGENRELSSPMALSLSDNMGGWRWRGGQKVAAGD